MQATELSRVKNAVVEQKRLRKAAEARATTAETALASVTSERDEARKKAYDLECKELNAWLDNLAAESFKARAEIAETALAVEQARVKELLAERDGWKPRESQSKTASCQHVDRLPYGHAVIEQCDLIDGRVRQTVEVKETGEDYERVVHADKAYGEEPPNSEIADLIECLKSADDQLKDHGVRLVGTQFSSVRDTVRNAIAILTRFHPSAAPPPPSAPSGLEDLRSLGEEVPLEYETDHQVAAARRMLELGVNMQGDRETMNNLVTDILKALLSHIDEQDANIKAAIAVGRLAAKSAPSPSQPALNLARELEEANAIIARLTSDREYVVGWNAGFEHVHGPLRFPTKLRKMWSGSEVQKWLDEQRIEAARTALDAIEGE